MNRPPNPLRDQHRRLESDASAASNRGDHAEANRLWKAAGAVKRRGIGMLAPCCQGTGFADYAAVPCPNPQCPTKSPNWPTPEEIEAYVAEAEAGFELDRLRPRTRPCDT